MDLTELRTVLSREQAHTELQPLDEDFYERVGEYIASVRRTRQDRIADTATPFDDAEIQRLTDEISTAKELTTKLYNRRTTKVLDKAVLAAFGYETDMDSMTPREHALFEETVNQIDKTAQNMLPEIGDQWFTNRSQLPGMYEKSSSELNQPLFILLLSLTTYLVVGILVGARPSDLTPIEIGLLLFGLLIWVLAAIEHERS